MTSLLHANTDNLRSLGFSFISPNPGKVTGLSSYTESLIRAWSGRHPELSVSLITNARAEIFEHLVKAPNVTILSLGSSGCLPYKLWSIYAHLRASILARTLKLDCLVSTTPQGSFLPIVDQLVVVHDTYDLERQFRSLSHVLYSRAVRWLSMQAASGVICVSEATLNDVRKLQNPNTSRFKVIKEASKYPPMRRDIDLTTRRSNGRFLFVANVERTKNVAVLLDALRLAERRQLPLQVEWIGRDSDNGVAEWIRVNGALTNFFPRGFVTNEELGEAYEMCIALIVPSFREGFCLPVLEAHSFGTPVIGSDIPILREVIGRGGIFFDPMNADALLQALCELSMNRNVLDSLRREAILNANSYSWHRAAEELEQFVEELRHA